LKAPGDRQKTSFLTGQPRFASRPLGSRAAKRTGQPPETGDGVAPDKPPQPEYKVKVATLNNLKYFLTDWRRF
jgi:hypothetical protein